MGEAKRHLDKSQILSSKKISRKTLPIPGSAYFFKTASHCRKAPDCWGCSEFISQLCGQDIDIFWDPERVVDEADN